MVPPVGDPVSDDILPQDVTSLLDTAHSQETSGVFGESRYSLPEPQAHEAFDSFRDRAVYDESQRTVL